MFTLEAPLSLRLAGPQDQVVLQQLFADSREDLIDLPCASDLKEQLLEMQMRSQEQGIRYQYPLAQNWLVLLHDIVVGRFIVQQDERDLRLIDLVIRSESRRQQLASRLLCALKKYAEDRQLFVSLAVNHSNVNAFNLYARHGFDVMYEDELFVHMRYQHQSQVPLRREN